MVSNNNTHPSLGVQDPAPKTTKITKNIKLYVVNTGLYFLEMYLFRIVDAKCPIVISKIVILKSRSLVSEST